MYQTHFPMFGKTVFYNCPLVEKGTLEIDPTSCKMSESGVYCIPIENDSSKETLYCGFTINYLSTLVHVLISYCVILILLIVEWILFIENVSVMKNLNFLQVLFYPFRFCRSCSGYKSLDQQIEIEMVENVETTNEPEVVIN